MHPAFSVIVFTTASGAGYGLVALMGVLAALGRLPADRWFGLAGLGLGLAAVTFGLVSSTFHLGHPERAWRAISQWRSSWLSREGALAILTFVPAGLFALGWVLLADNGGVWAAFGLAAAAMAALTVACTGMIYASLKPIRRWANGWTVPNYLLLGLMSGALWLDAVAAAFGLELALPAMIALAAIVAAGAGKLGYWRFIDRSQSASTPESATGLGAFGKVRLLEAPHTNENYLLKEMGYRIARKHAAKLRRIAALLAFAVPLALTSSLFVLSSLPAIIAAVLAALSGTAGILIERWLFFAEARHAVTLYYGACEA
ncbi:MAG: dimethyl sulfoxide reductase anchor subunit family protein [Pseudomonadota bacterium]